jgi:hypothetical protein
VVDALNEECALTMVRKFWLEADLIFCKPKPDGWMPEPTRFPPKVSVLEKPAVRP